jgi:hypothetical protein
MKNDKKSISVSNIFDSQVKNAKSGWQITVIKKEKKTDKKQ